MTVIAAGGAGKTTALSQVCERESAHIDVWHSCSSGDNDSSRLIASLAETLAVMMSANPAPDPTIETLGDLILAASPRRVCLVVDDCHILLRADGLQSLIDELPSNGHVLLAGRSLPPVELARLDAQGKLAEVEQTELLLTEDEVNSFAALRGVDASVLIGAEGWPAFVELASTGTEASSRRYLEELTIAGLGEERKRQLALFHLIGGGDDELAEVTTGLDVDTLVGELPLVRRSESGARLHDLWGELLRPATEGAAYADERRLAALAASKVLRSRGEFDRAIDLATQVEAWDDVLESIAAACLVGVDGGLNLGQLERWSALLPIETSESAIGLLAAALIEREHDSTSDAMRDALTAAGDMFREEGRQDLELVALTQLGYAARIRADRETIGLIRSRIEELAKTHRPAKPFVEICDAWTALVTGRPDNLLIAAERLRSVELPTVWRATVNHLHAHALFNCGRPAEALDVVPRNIGDLPVPIPGALVTETQCYWYSGQPDRALAIGALGSDPRYGSRDRFIASTWQATMSAFAGQISMARQASQSARQWLGSSPGPLLQGQLAGVEALTLLAEGREQAAAELLEQLLQLAPLGEGISEQMLRGHIGVVYVIAAATREYWDSSDLGPSIVRMRTLARAYVAARENDDLQLVTNIDWPDPGIIASTFPVTWAMEFALFGAKAGRSEAEQTIEWLCDKWGQPARDALGELAESENLGAVTQTVLTRTPLPPERGSELKVLGVPGLTHQGLATRNPDWRRERVRELLLYLVLNPRTTRERVAGTLWPELPGARAAKNLRTTLTYLHQVLEPDRRVGDATWFVRVDGSEIELHDSLPVDLWDFRALVSQAEGHEAAGQPRRAMPLYVQAAELWNGDLMEGADQSWIDLDRIHTRSQFVRAACRGAELLLASSIPEEAISISRAALGADPWNMRAFDVLADSYAAIGDAAAANSVREMAQRALVD